MADFDSVRDSINASIKQNGTGAITGPVLNGVLNEMVDAADEQVSQLSQDVYVVTRKSRDANKALQTDGTYRNSEGSTTDIFEVVPGNTYLITGRVGGLANLCLAAFWDANGNFIAGSAQYLTTGTATPYSDVSVTAPANAAIMKVCGNILAAYPNPPSARVGARDYGVFQKLDGLKSSSYKQIVTNGSSYTDNSITFVNSGYAILVVQRQEGGAIKEIKTPVMGRTFTLTGLQRLVLHANDNVEIMPGGSAIMSSDIVLLGLNSDTGKFGYGALFPEYLARTMTAKDELSSVISIKEHLVQGNPNSVGVIAQDSYYGIRVTCILKVDAFSVGGTKLVAKTDSDKYIRNVSLYNSVTGVTSSWLYPNANSTNEINYTFADDAVYDTIILTVCYANTSTAITPSDVTTLDIGGVFAPIVMGTDKRVLLGKTFSVMGDSIGTNNDGDTPLYTITANDVGRTITSWITWYDYNNSREDTPSGTTKTIGGVAITLAMVGTQQSFTPTSDDIGKTLGTPRWAYNQTYGATPWWKIVADKLGLAYNASASWNGNSYTSHEESDNLRKIGYGWHPLQIARLANRDSNGNRIAPDYIFLCRGTNDATHSPYAKITDFADGINPIPDNDSVDGGYGFKEALAITISKIQNTYPSAKIYVCTLSPFRRLSDDTFPMDNGENTMQAYNKAVKDVAEYMGVKVIDFAKCWTFYNCVSGGYVNSSDYTHPVQKGHDAMAAQAVLDILK